MKELEDLLRATEQRGWKVAGGGNKHFKLYCPCPAKHMKTVSTTPSNPNYQRDLISQLKRATCWEG